MAGRGSAEHFTTLGVERRKERKRPVPIIFKTVPLCPPRAQGEATETFPNKASQFSSALLH
jgi:hypothetical protein